MFLSKYENFQGHVPSYYAMPFLLSIPWYVPEKSNSEGEHTFVYCLACKDCKFDEDRRCMSDNKKYLLWRISCYQPLAYHIISMSAWKFNVLRDDQVQKCGCGKIQCMSLPCTNTSENPIL